MSAKWRYELEQLYRAHQPALVRAAAKLSGSEAEAWDVVQDTFERAAQSFDLYRCEGRGFAWLRTIMTRLFIDRCRKRRPADSIDEHDIAAPATEETPLWSSIDEEDLRCAIASLTPARRSLLEEHAFARRPYVSLAAAHHVRVATVGTRLHRIRRDLREVLLRRSGGGA